MFGASFGGTTRGGHQGVDCSASSLITPPNFGAGAGSCLPLMVVVALGEPGVPVVSSANTWEPAKRNNAVNSSASRLYHLERTMLESSPE